MSQNLNQKLEIRNSKQIRNSNFVFLISYFPRLFRISNFLFRICFVFLISYFEFIAISQPASAQEVSLAVSPPVVEILLAPNKQVTQTFTLMTQGQALDITPELHLATPSDDQGHMTIDPSPLNPASLPLIVTIHNPQSTTNDLRSTIYNLTLEAANTDLAQDVYLALVFRASPSSTINDLRSTITSPSISALILVTLTGEGFIPIDLELNNFDPSLFHDSWLPLILVPSLKNKSSVMIRPQGLYEIISPSGKTLLSLPLYPNLILGNSSRLIQANTPGVKGSHTPGVVTWSPRWSAIGPHRLRLTITTEGGTQLTQLEKVIWLLPIRIIVILTVLLALFIIFLVTRGKSLTPPLDRLSQKTYS